MKKLLPLILLLVLLFHNKEAYTYQICREKLNDRFLQSAQASAQTRKTDTLHKSFVQVS